MRSARAFTLVELLVTVGIMGSMATLLLPGLSSAREVSRRSVCRANVEKITRACLVYAEDWRGYGPTEGTGALGRSEYPVFWLALAPYWGQSVNTPRQLQPWCATAGCPSYCLGSKPFTTQYQQAIGVNEKICNPTADSNGNRPDYKPLYTIQRPQEVAMSMETHFACLNFFSVLNETAGGSMFGKSVGVYARHKAEGLSFGFVDGHVAFLGYYKDPSSGVQTFLAGNPRYQ